MGFDMPSPAQTVAYLSNQQQPQQGGYQPPQQGGYYPPQQGGYQQGGYQPPQQGGYYPPQQGGYPPQRSAYTFSHEDKAIAQGLMGDFKRWMWYWLFDSYYWCCHAHVCSNNWWNSYTFKFLCLYLWNYCWYDFILCWYKEING